MHILKSHKAHLKNDISRPNLLNKQIELNVHLPQGEITGKSIIIKKDMLQILIWFLIYEKKTNLSILSTKKCNIVFNT